MLEDRVGLAPDRYAALAGMVATQRTLEHVVRWGLAFEPPRLVCDVIVQDEYTHDVVQPYEELFLVYDTT